MKTIALLLVLFVGSTCMAAQYQVTAHSASPALCLPYYSQNTPDLQAGDVVNVDWSARGVVVQGKGLIVYYPVGTHPFGGEDIGTTTNSFANPNTLVITYDIGPGTNISSGGFLKRSGNRLVVNSGFSECDLILQ